MVEVGGRGVTSQTLFHAVKYTDNSVFFEAHTNNAKLHALMAL